MTISPAAVDVRSGPQTLSIAVAVQDTVEVSRLRLTTGTTDGGAFVTWSGRRASGTGMDAVWTASVTMPRWTAPGEYSIWSVELVDVAGGYAEYHPLSLGTATPEGTRTHWGAWPSTFTVVSVADVTRPSVTSFQVSTRTVDTRAHARRVRFTVTAADSQSGVVSVLVWADRDRAPVGIGAELARAGAGTRRWTGTVVVPRWLGAGRRTWRLAVVARDGIGNASVLSRAVLRSRHWPSSLVVRSRTDATRPRLRSVRVSPLSVDARTGDRRVSFTVRVTDAQSGAATPRLRLGPATNEQLDPVFTTVSGTALDRTFRGYFVVPQCGEPGPRSFPLRVTALDARDNVRAYHSGDLQAHGWPAGVTVRQSDSAPPAP